MLEIIGIIILIILVIFFWWLSIPAAIIFLFIIAPELLVPVGAIAGFLAFFWVLGIFIEIDGMDVKWKKTK